MTIYAVRARMVDGSISDLLQFLHEADAEAHARIIRHECRLLGYDRIWVVRRRVIGKEPLERRRRPPVLPEACVEKRLRNGGTEEPA